ARTPRAAIRRALCSVVIAPPEIAIAPIRSAPQKADQNPMKGPKEKAQKIRSPGPTPAAGKTYSAQIRSHHSQDSAVSSQRSGRVPLEPDVWWRRMYRSSG